MFQLYAKIIDQPSQTFGMFKKKTSIDGSIISINVAEKALVLVLWTVTMRELNEGQHNGRQPPLAKQYELSLARQWGDH